MKARIKPLIAAGPILGALLLHPGPAQPSADPNPGPPSGAPGTSGIGASGTVYTITARNARRNHRPLGPATVLANGVPAEPVDALCWSGAGSEQVQEAVAYLKVDPVSDVGRLRAT